VFIYIITSLWFRGKRNLKLKVFSALGLLYSLWVLTNGINALLSAELYAVIFPILPQTLVSVVPAVLLIYILHFTESKYAKKSWVIWVLIAMTAVDLLVLWTNPWHNEFIIGYDGHTPISGSLFPVHAFIAYVPVVIAVIVLFRYIVKNIGSTPVFVETLYQNGLGTSSCSLPATR